jgi:diaminohydroxyphosphoribosylaminopyrimidine deaminase/5-amino-6-(5-phosphoribosylamino)uracil reductase
MRRALFLAERGRGTTSPNPMVGAVVVSPDGVVVGQGAHRIAGGPHAEVAALDAAGSRARHSTLYVTLEPCCHTGRTGPCVERIVDAGIARVVAAHTDPNPRVSGGGFAFLRARGVIVSEDVERDAAAVQLAPFLTQMTKRRPHVTVKMAVSQDGFVGSATRRVKLTGSTTDRFMHRRRAGVDAIAVGSSTILIDDPELTARLAFRQRPLARVIFDRRGRVPETARVFSTRDSGPVIMMAAATVADALEQLAADGIQSLLVEGGPTLQRAFADAGVVDHVEVIRTPVFLGNGISHAKMPEGRTMTTKRLGADELVEWDVYRPD